MKDAGASRRGGDYMRWLASGPGDVLRCFVRTGPGAT